MFDTLKKKGEYEIINMRKMFESSHRIVRISRNYIVLGEYFHTNMFLFAVIP